MANRLIPDDEDFWALLGRGKEPLLLQLALAEDGERDSDQPTGCPCRSPTGSRWPPTTGSRMHWPSSAARRRWRPGSRG